ncbi:MAG: NAD-dependent epimerase/dehydratase family protein [Caldilinea sp. CFX5]|nr:NAD-dependent epimerase/dehydratase family protein [Caldilinea sp. CFX5]
MEDFSVLTLTDDYRVAFRRMRNFIAHPVDEVYELRFNGGGCIRATASHSVFIFAQGKIIAKPSAELQEGDLMITFLGDVRKEEKTPHVFDLRTLLAPYETTWMADSITRRRIMFQAVAEQSAIDGVIQQLGNSTFYRVANELIEDGYLTRTNGIYAVTSQGMAKALTLDQDVRWNLTRHQLTVPGDSLTVTPLLMEVFGLYVAEGHAAHTAKELSQNNRSVTFTIGRTETAALEKLLTCGRDVLGIEPSVKMRDSTIQVSYSSYWVHALFSQFGATAATKRLPDWIWNQPKAYVEAFLRGYEGDARIRDDGQRLYTTINQSLAVSIVWLARLNDMNSCISQRVTQQIAGQIPPGATQTHQRICWDIAISAEHYHPDQRQNWRTPMARCLPTDDLAQLLNCRQHQKVSLGYKELVSKDRVQAFLKTFVGAESESDAFEDACLMANSDIGVAKIKSIRRIPGNFMVYDVSVPGNERFFGGNVPCLLHNTDEVYGHIHGDHRSLETDNFAPRSPYAASKASAEHFVNAYHITYGLPITISRGANNIGPYQYPEKVVPLFITNALNDQSLPLYGDGQQRRDYQYVMDHCDAVDLVLHQGVIGEAYNIGTGFEMTNAEMVEILLDELGKPRSLIQHVEDRLGHDRRYCLNVDKIMALGWEPDYTHEQAIRATVHWYVNNRWWWEPIRNGEFKEYYARVYGNRKVLSA